MEMKFKEGAEKQAWEKDLREKFVAHPAAARFPMMEYDEFMALADDIVDNGQNQPIIVFNDQIIDGRNRFEACLKMGVEPKFKVFEHGADQIETWVISENLQRRHLTKEQKIAMVVKLFNEEKWTQVKIQKTLKIPQPTINRWLKDNIQMDNTGTRTDTLGRARPTKYNKSEKPEKEETPEDRQVRLVAEAAEDLQEWFETFAELGVDRLKKIFSCCAK